MSAPLSQHGPAGEARPGVGTGDSGFDKSALLRQYAARFHVKTVVETGLYHGHGSGMGVPNVAYVAIDWQEENIEQARIARPDGWYVLGDSGRALTEWWPTSSFPRPVLFWLDAHALTEDEGAPTVCPLLGELQAISAWRDAPTSVVLIDDLWGMGRIHGWPTLDEVRELADRSGHWHRVEEAGVMRLEPTRVAPGSAVAHELHA